MRQQGKTVLLTTHYMEEAEVLCRRVAIIDHGKILALGAPRDLIDEFVPERAIEVPISSNVEKGRLEVLPAVSHVEIKDGIAAIHTTNIRDSMTAILQGAGDLAVSLDDLRIQRGTLEESVSPSHGKDHSRVKALWTLTYYTGVQFARDKVALFWTLAFPVVLMVIIGYAFGDSGTASLPVGLVIEDRGPAGQAVAGALAGIPLFEVSTGSQEEELAALNEGDRRAVVIIPSDLTAAWQRRELATVPGSSRRQPATVCGNGVEHRAAGSGKCAARVYAATEFGGN